MDEVTQAPEEWRQVPGAEGCYEVSDQGRIRSISRPGANGRILRPSRDSYGYPLVTLGVHGKRLPRTIHRLVASAFLGPRPPEHQIRHLDGDKTNNALANLAYGTASENMQDSVRHGAHRSQLKTACPQGHPYDEVNTGRTRDGRRYCIACSRVRASAYYHSHNAGG